MKTLYLHISTYLSLYFQPTSFSTILTIPITIVLFGSHDFGQYHITEYRCLTSEYGLLYSFTYYGISYVLHFFSIYVVNNSDSDSDSDWIRCY